MSKLHPFGDRLPVQQLIAHLRTPLYRNGYALMISALGSSGLGMVYWALAARLYSAESVGLNSAAISAVTLVAGLAQMNLNGAMLRFVPVARGATYRLVGIAYAISVTLACLVGLVASLVLPGVLGASQGGMHGASFAFWFTCATICWSVFVLQDGVLIGLRRTLWVPLENISFAVAKILLLIVFASRFEQYGLFVSWNIPVAFAIIPISLLIFRRFIPAQLEATAQQETTLTAHQVVHFAAGNYLGLLFSLAATNLLPLIVTQRAGASANAYFYQPWLISNALLFVTTNLSQSLIVEAAFDMAKLHYYVRRVIIHTLRLLAPCIALLLLTAPYVLLFFGQAYVEQGTTLLRLLAVSAIPSAINLIYLSLARVQLQLKRIVIIQGILCLGALALSYLLLPIYGIAGVGCAWLVSQSAVAIVLILGPLRPYVWSSVHKRNL